MKSNLPLLVLLITIAFLFQGCTESQIRQSTTCNPEWQLVWTDNFDSFDTSRWKKATHTFGINESQFVPENVKFQNGTMKLYLTAEPTSEKNYSGAEYRTVDSYLYGKFETRMKFAPGSGVVSAFFTYRHPPQPRWNEIDIEFIGKDTRTIQFTHWWDSSPNFKPVTYSLDFASDEEFHVYAFEWLPESIKWYVDGKLMHTATENIPNLPQRIMMNVWICNIIDWAGSFDPNILPVYAECDYVKYYKAK